MFADLSTLVDPIDLEDAQALFPFIVFTPVSRAEDDPCSGCPELSFFGPLPAEAVLVYRWWGSRVRQPVGSCCLEQELRDLTGSDAVTELRVEVLLDDTTDTPSSTRW